MRISDWSSDVCSSDLPDKPNKQRQSKQAANFRHVFQYLYNKGGVGAFRSSQDVQSAATELVGWVEHSETHRFPAKMGFAALYPSYLPQSTTLARDRKSTRLNSSH